MTPVIVRFIKKKLDIAKLRDSEHILPAPWPFVKSRLLHYGEIKYRVYGKRKIDDEIFSKSMSNKEIKLLKTILMYRIGIYLPIFFIVVTMNCKRQVNGKLGSRSTNSLLPFAVNVILALFKSANLNWCPEVFWPFCSSESNHMMEQFRGQFLSHFPTQSRTV